MEIGVVITFVSSRSHEDSSRSHQTVKSFIEESAFPIEIFTFSLAERDDTWLLLLFGIVKYVFESQYICGTGISIAVFLPDERGVVNNRIAD
jgi:hypothetical protein